MKYNLYLIFCDCKTQQLFVLFLSLVNQVKRPIQQKVFSESDSREIAISSLLSLHFFWTPNGTQLGSLVSPHSVCLPTTLSPVAACRFLPTLISLSFPATFTADPSPLGAVSAQKKPFFERILHVGVDGRSILFWSIDEYFSFVASSMSPHPHPLLGPVSQLLVSVGPMLGRHCLHCSTMDIFGSRRSSCCCCRQRRH
jgi:hypothetical protein